MNRELSEAELIGWGEVLGRELEPPLFLALRGDLGAGKSTLARAIARGAGVTGPVPSPTFNLLIRYDTPRGIALVHADLYRLDDPAEVWELGWAELPGPDEIVMVEWPERAESLLPEPRWDIRIRGAGAERVRTVSVEAIGMSSPGAPLPGWSR